MLCRKEEKDPRKCLREGADVTACGVQFLQAVKNKCRQQFDDYANCIDYRSDSKMFVAK
jgi:NADH dehydrogenase (ubiquinone) 1 alpha subcomplex subunit 8